MYEITLNLPEEEKKKRETENLIIYPLCCSRLFDDRERSRRGEGGREGKHERFGIIVPRDNPIAMWYKGG